MPDLDILPILVAAVAAFIASGAWYAVFGEQLAALNDVYADAGKMPAWTVIAEVGRSLVVAVVLAGLADKIGIDGWGEALLLAVVVWAGFPFIILSGSVLHEKVPWRLAAIHVGDWLVKLVLISLIVGLWR